MSQKKLAEESGVSPQRISKIISGKENLTLKTIQDLNSALGIKISTNQEAFKEKEQKLIDLEKALKERETSLDIKEKRLQANEIALRPNSPRVKHG